MKIIKAVLGLVLKFSRRNPEYAFWFVIALSAAVASYICHLYGV